MVLILIFFYFQLPRIISIFHTNSHISLTLSLQICWAHLVSELLTKYHWRHGNKRTSNTRFSFCLQYKYSFLNSRDSPSRSNHFLYFTVDHKEYFVLGFLPADGGLNKFTSQTTEFLSAGHKNDWQTTTVNRVLTETDWLERASPGDSAFYEDRQLASESSSASSPTTRSSAANYNGCRLSIAARSSIHPSGGWGAGWRITNGRV